jgi:hypothetical protein
MEYLLTSSIQYMNNLALLKGQRVTSPGGPGEVIETIGDKVVVKLDTGETNTYPSAEVADDSNAG